MPPGWEQLTSPEGYTYFYNQNTGVRLMQQCPFEPKRGSPLSPHAPISVTPLSRWPLSHALTRAAGSRRRRNGRSPSEAGERRYKTMRHWAQLLTAPPPRVDSILAQSRAAPISTRPRACDVYTMFTLSHCARMRGDSPLPARAPPSIASKERIALQAVTE